MKRLIGMAAFVIGVLGCFHRSEQRLRFGEEVRLPRAIASDSIATAKWVAQQQAACPGKLVMSEGGLLEFSLDGRPVPYQSHILSVFCERR